MSRAAVAALFFALIAGSSISAASTPPLLPGIAKQAGGQELSVRCLSASEWTRRGLPRGTVAARRGKLVLLAERTCSVVLGYAVSFPHAPGPGTPQELDAAVRLFRFLEAAVSARRLSSGQADCRLLESVVPALTALGAPSRRYAVGVRTRLLVARKRLGIEIEPARGCSVKLPKAAPS